jgi:hypothetical protein
MAPADRFFDNLSIRDIAVHGRQAIRTWGENSLRGRRQARAIEQRHRVTARQQRCGDIEPNETGAAENEDSHLSVRISIAPARRI